MVWYSHLFQSFPQFTVIHTVRGFGIDNKAEIDAFLELSCFFHDPADVGSLISGSSAFSTSLNIWKFTVHILLKPGLENFEHYFTSMSMYRLFSCVVGRGCLLRPVHFLGKTLLVFALLHSVFQGQICLLFQVFLDFLLLHSSPV